MVVPTRLVHLFLETLAVVAALPAEIDRRGAGASTEKANEEELLNSQLQPGDSFVGWIGEPLQLAELLERPPQIKSIKAWDAPPQREICTSSLQAVGDRTLSVIETGAAYVIRADGTESIDGSSLSSRNQGSCSYTQASTGSRGWIKMTGCRRISPRAWGYRSYPSRLVTSFASRLGQVKFRSAESDTQRCAQGYCQSRRHLDAADVRDAGGALRLRRPLRPVHIEGSRSQMTARWMRERKMTSSLS